MCVVVATTNIATIFGKASLTERYNIGATARDSLETIPLQNLIGEEFFATKHNLVLTHNNNI